MNRIFVQENRYKSQSQVDLDAPNALKFAQYQKIYDKSHQT